MPSQDFPAMERPIASRRTAWLVVIIMTTAFLLALVAVIWGFMRQARIVMAGRPAAAATAGGAAAVLTLAPGAHIVSATTDAGKLVLQVATPSGGEVEIMDLASGKVTAQVKTVPGK